MANIQNPLINYENQWVALSSDRKKVIKSAKKLELLIKKLESKDKDLVLTKVLPFNTSYAPHVSKI